MITNVQNINPWNWLFLQNKTKQIHIQGLALMQKLEHYTEMSSALGINTHLNPHVSGQTDDKVTAKTLNSLFTHPLVIYRSLTDLWHSFS